MSPEFSAHFWAMGGYADFVWGSFAAALAVYLWNALAPRWQRRQILDRLEEAAGDEPANEA